jgi:hypothetical protein
MRCHVQGFRCTKFLWNAGICLQSYMISDPRRLYLLISHSKNLNLISSKQVKEKSLKISGIKWHFEYVECSLIMSIHGKWECMIRTQWDSKCLQVSNKFNLNIFIYGYVNDIISNSDHTMSSPYHKSLEVFTGLWMRTPFFWNVLVHHQLPSDTASQIRQTGPQFVSLLLHFVCTLTFRFTKAHLALCSTDTSFLQRKALQGTKLSSLEWPIQTFKSIKLRHAGL